MTNLYSKVKKAFSQPLETERLLVEPYSIKQSKALADFFEADDQFFAKLLFGNYPEKFAGVQYSVPGKKVQYTPEFMEHHFIKSLLNVWKPRTFPLLFSDKKSSKALGSLQILDDPKHGPRLTYTTLPSERRNGYASEAYDATLDFMLRLDLFTKSEIYAHVRADNQASINFLLSKNFTMIGQAINSDKNSVDRGLLCYTFARAVSAPVAPATTHKKPTNSHSP